MRRKKDSFRFTGRKHSKKGITSCIIGIFTVVLLIVLAAISGSMEGQGTQTLGAVAIIGFFLSIIGFISAISSIKQRDIYMAAPITGIVSNGIMFIIYMSLYIIGLL